MHLSDVHVGTISSAQGSEWDYVILSAVHAGNSGKGLGILSDWHLLNVALTRSILGLVVMGHSCALRDDKNWRLLIRECEQREILTSEVPSVKLLEGSQHLRARRPIHKRRVVLDCLKPLRESLQEDVPMASSRKLSDEDFMKQKQLSGRLASYGKSSQSGSHGPQVSRPNRVSKW